MDGMIAFLLHMAVLYQETSVITKSLQVKISADRLAASVPVIDFRVVGRGLKCMPRDLCKFKKTEV